VLLGVSVLLTAGASATVYLDEDFDERTLPPGWEVQRRGSGSSSYSFMPGYGGYYYYASVTVNSEQYAAISLTSPPLTVPVGTLYYRFDLSTYRYGTAGVSGDLSVRYAGSSSNIFYDYFPSNSDWHEESGSFYVGESRPIVVIWELSGGAAPGRYGTGSLSMDNAVIADTPNIGIDPTSLGRVKGLFR
jgi:hypothetical protein